MVSLQAMQGNTLVVSNFASVYFLYCLPIFKTDVNLRYSFPHSFCCLCSCGFLCFLLKGFSLLLPQNIGIPTTLRTLSANYLFVLVSCHILSSMRKRLKGIMMCSSCRIPTDLSKYGTETFSLLSSLAFHSSKRY